MAIGISRYGLFGGNLSFSRGAGPGSEAASPVRLSTTAASPWGPPRMMKKPAGPAYTLSRVIPRAWSWYQVVAARPRFGYWNVAKPRPQAAP